MQISCGEGKRRASCTHCGSGEAVFPSDPRALAPSPCTQLRYMDSLPALWSMKRDQLQKELASYGIEPHPSWTVAELREMVREQRDARKNEVTVPKGLSRMSLEELKREAGKASLMLPPKATRGVLIKMLRDQAVAPGDTLSADTKDGATTKSPRST